LASPAVQAVLASPAESAALVVRANPAA
jgi:hypothetical protein